MGYTTDLLGEFTLDKPLTPEHQAYLEKLADTRRMKRDAELTANQPDPVRHAAGLPVGDAGEFFVGNESADGVIDNNHPPATQPGLWCQWVPNEDGTAIEWDCNEKFYAYTKWIKYLVEKLLKPWGYVLNGTVEWSGEDVNDIGLIEIKNNEVTVKEGVISYGDEEMKEIIVIIEDGVVQNIIYPEGPEKVKILIHDYDTKDATENDIDNPHCSWNIRKDDNGDLYQVLEFPR